MASTHDSLQTKTKVINAKVLSVLSPVVPFISTLHRDRTGLRSYTDMKTAQQSKEMHHLFTEESKQFCTHPQTLTELDWVVHRERISLLSDF